jgi:thiamine biosynthesis protein ThiS
MTVSVNGKPMELVDSQSVAAVLARLDYKKSLSSVWVNGKRLLEVQYGTYILSQNDEVKVVRLFSGG